MFNIGKKQSNGIKTMHEYLPYIGSLPTNKCSILEVSDSESCSRSKFILIWCCCCCSGRRFHFEDHPSGRCRRRQVEHALPNETWGWHEALHLPWHLRTARCQPARRSRHDRETHSRFPTRIQVSQVSVQSCLYVDLRNRTKCFTHSVIKFRNTD